MRLSRLLSAAVLTVGIVPTAVHAQEADRPLSWRFEKLWEVGRGANDSINLIAVSAKNIAVDDRGRLFVLDAMQLNVTAFDARGRTIAVFGKRGNGPGEFARAGSISALADGSTFVYDAENLRWVAFNSEWTVSQAGADLHVAPALIAPRVIGTSSVVSAIGYRDSSRVELFAGATHRRLASLANPQSRSTPPVCSITDYLGPPIFSPEISLAVRGTRFATTQGEATVDVHDGARVWKLTRPQFRRRRATESDAARALGEGKVLRFRGMAPCTIPAEMIIKAHGVARLMPAYSDLAIDPDGRVWAIQFALPGETRRADIFDPQSGYLGTASLGSALPVAFMSNGDMISLELDADDLPYLVAYRIKN